MPDLNLDPFLLIPLAVVLALMAMPVVSRRIWGAVEYMPVHEVYGRLMKDQPIAVIDIRDARSFAGNAIPGAVNVSPDQLESYIAETLDEDTPVTLVCQSDLSATRHAARLRKRGYPRVTALKGGIFAWRRAKYPLDRPSSGNQERGPLQAR